MGNKITNNKILVTGGAGFIGSHLVDKLLFSGYDVTVLDNLCNGKLENLKEAFLRKNFNFIHGDILDPEICFNTTKGADIVFHLACLGVRHSIHSPYENHKVNAEGTLNMLEASKKNNVKKFYYISSSEVYGDVQQFPVNENCVPKPKTVYGSSKLAGENYTYSYFACYGLDTTIFRIFNNYGSRAHYEGDAGEIIPRAIVNILYGKNPVIFGNGSNTRDFFFVKDTASVLTNFINIPGLEGEIINIGTGIEITIKELIEKIIKAIGNFNIKIDFLESRPADVPRLLVDPKKFQSIMKYKSCYSFDQGLNETVAYYKDLMKEKNLIDDIDVLNWKK